MRARSQLLAGCWLLLSLFTGTPAYAWDSTGHHLAAWLAWDRLSDTQRQRITTLLEQHPRLALDSGTDRPTGPTDGGITAQQLQFGLAAVWPDRARGLPDALQQRYNQPDWHWIDGAWVRDDADRQGNIYLGMEALPDRPGETEGAADNVLTALEQAERQLRDHTRPPDERALALSWFLHLLADLHQPLHSGALFAPGTLADGDRGGNRIPVATGQDGSNLHALWDRALRSPDTAAQYRRLQRLRAELTINTDWAPTVWLAESRDLLHAQVYPPRLRQRIQQRSAAGDAPPVFDPSVTYLQDMRRIARQQIIAAAERIAAALEAIPTGSVE